MSDLTELQTVHIDVNIVDKLDFTQWQFDLTSNTLTIWFEPQGIWSGILELTHYKSDVLQTWFDYIPLWFNILWSWCDKWRNWPGHGVEKS